MSIFQFRVLSIISSSIDCTSVENQIVLNEILYIMRISIYFDILLLCPNALGKW